MGKRNLAASFQVPPLKAPTPPSTTPSIALLFPTKMSISEQITTVQTHLEDVNNARLPEVDGMLLSGLSDRVTVDRAAVKENSAAIFSLLQTVIAVLINDQLAIDYTPVVHLLDGLLSQVDYDAIIQLFGLQYILEALASPNENIQIIALKVIRKAHPVDILANTEVVPHVVDILATGSTSVKVVSEVENTLDVLFSGELIRRRLLGNGVVDVLFGMKSSKHTIIISRLLNIVTLLMPHLAQGEAQQELYQFEVTLDEDILFTLNLIKFYTDVVDIVDSNLHKEWLLEDVHPAIESIADLYRQRFEQPDIEYFAVSSIHTLFSKLSHVAPDIFSKLDDKYVEVSKSDTFLLATLNPVYLAKKHPTILKSIPLTIDNIQIIRNLTSDPTSFNIITPNLTSSQFLRLPYLELMALLSKFSQFDHSSKYLLNELPQVMNKLLKGDNVVEPQTWELRRDTLENLLKLPHDTLNVWHAAVQLEYDKIVKGRAINPDVEVMDVAL